MLLLPIVGNYKVLGWGGFQWHNIHTKFNLNPYSDSRRTDRHIPCVMQRTPNKILTAHGPAVDSDMKYVHRQERSSLYVGFVRRLVQGAYRVILV
jgi:hypothetical protein